MSELIVNNDGPYKRCFGCGQQNDRGLRLAFRPRTDGGVESEYVAPDFFAGPPGVVHGGIQAALLDEVLGVAAGAATGERNLNIVTVDFSLRYRRPVPTNTPLTIRGRLLRVDGRDYFVEGEIIDSEGTILTSGEARWRRIDESEPKEPAV